MTPQIVRKLVGGIWRTVEAEEAGGGGSQTVAEITPVTLTPTIIRGSKNTLVALAPTPGSGKAIIDATLLFLFGAGFAAFGAAFQAHVGVTDDAGIEPYGVTHLPLLDDALQGGAANDLVLYSLSELSSPAWSGPIATAENSALNFWTEVADPTGGTGNVTVVGTITTVTLS